VIVDEVVFRVWDEGTFSGLLYPTTTGGVFVEGDGRKNILLRVGYYFDYDASELEGHDLKGELDQTTRAEYRSQLKSALAKKGWKS
jgi:hypothetical protein